MIDGHTAGLVSARYEKLLLLRLIQVSDAVLSDTPELAAKTGFAECWEVATGMSGEGLALASRQPLLAAWVQTAEVLVSNGIHRRYPEAHPSRHLKDFGRLVLSWTSQLPDGARGQFYMAGRQALQLFHGDLILAGDKTSADEAIVWAVENRVLRIFRLGGGALFEADLSDPGAARLLDPDWELVTTRRVGRILIDLKTPEYYRGRHGVFSPDGLEARLRQARSGLDGQLWSLVEAVCRTAAYPSPDVSWIAGLVRLGPDGREAPGLLELACRDLVERVLALWPLGDVFGPRSPGSDMHSVFVELGARRLANRLAGRGEVVDPDAKQSRTWAGLSSLLSQTEAGLSVMELLGEEPVNAGPAPGRADAAPPANSTLDLGRHLPKPGLILRKTRRAAAFTIDDFSAIDALSELPPAELERLLSALRSGASASEEQAFCLALTAYLLGRFDLCAGALLRCLDYDLDVEEYWHLLAFALRHLRRPREHDEIVFGGRRDRAALEELASYRANLSEHAR